MQTPTTTPVKRGFAVCCIRCGEANAITVDLDDVSIFRCTSCETDFSADDVRDTLAGWSAVLAWVDTAPVVTV